MPKMKSSFDKKRKTYFREWRKHRAYTLEQVAEKLSVTAGTLSHLELGKVGYTQPMLEALAEVYGCNIVDLLTRDPADPESPYTLWQSLTPGARRQALAILAALKSTEQKP